MRMLWKSGLTAYGFELWIPVDAEDPSDSSKVVKVSVVPANGGPSIRRYVKAVDLKPAEKLEADAHIELDRLREKVEELKDTDRALDKEVARGLKLEKEFVDHKDAAANKLKEMATEIEKLRELLRSTMDELKTVKAKETVSVKESLPNKQPTAHGVR